MLKHVVNDADGALEDITVVNTDLYLKCRLCLEEQGKLVIIPSLRQMIKFTFNIEISNFDGFSQLLCESCKSVLIHFNGLKETYIQKQKSLWDTSKKKLPLMKDNDKLDKKNTAHSSGSRTETIEVTNRFGTLTDDAVRSVKSKENVKVYQRKTPKLDVYERSQSVINSNKVTIKHTETENEKNVEKCKWDACFHRFFYCRFCNRKYLNRMFMNDHINKRHSHLVNQIAQQIDKHCKVTLSNIKNSSNFTGETDVVVLNANKIIRDINSLNYFNVYEKETSVKRTSDYADDSYEPVKKYKKRVAVFSSTDTSEDEVLKPRHYDISELKQNSEDPKINSNDYEVTNTHENVVNLMTSKPNKQVSPKGFYSKESTVKLIVGNVYNKMKRKKMVEEGDKYDFLTRKLINVGRKIMVKTGILSVGLLKYLEKRNLEIVWTRPRESDSNNQTVRINTKIEREKEISHFDGFVMVKEYGTDSRQKNKETKGADAYKTVLLNKTPVSNPKPAFIMTKKIDENSTKSILDSTICIESDEEVDVGSMPIITSTMSLAPEGGSPFNGKQDIEKPNPTCVAVKNNGSKQNIDNLLPKIKCKPVSELMALNPAKSSSSPPKLTFSQPSLLLNSLALPNTLTSSPFLYFQFVLTTHRLTLGLNFLGYCTTTIKSLIKFKVGAHAPDSSTTAAVLEVQLFAAQKWFGVNVTDKGKMIPIEKMSAPWQWEVLKSFTNEKVVQKLVGDVEKYYKEILDDVKLFLDLLQSIELVK